MKIVVATMTTNAAAAADSPFHGIEMRFGDFTYTYECVKVEQTRTKKKELRKGNF